MLHVASLALTLALGFSSADRIHAPQGGGAVPQRSGVGAERSEGGPRVRGERRVRRLRLRLQRLEERLHRRAAARGDQRPLWNGKHAKKGKQARRERANRGER